MTHLLEEMGHLLFQFLNALFVDMVSGGRVCWGWARFDSCWSSRSSAWPSLVAKLGQYVISLGRTTGPVSSPVCLVERKNKKQLHFSVSNSVIGNVLYLTVSAQHCLAAFRTLLFLRQHWYLCITGARESPLDPGYQWGCLLQGCRNGQLHLG